MAANKELTISSLPRYVSFPVDALFQLDCGGWNGSEGGARAVIDGLSPCGRSSGANSLSTTSKNTRRRNKTQAFGRQEGSVLVLEVELLLSIPCLSNLVIRPDRNV